VAVFQYTFTHKQYTERHKEAIHRTTQKFGKSAGRAPSLRVFGICLTTEEKALKKLRQGSRRVPAGQIVQSLRRKFNGRDESEGPHARQYNVKMDIKQTEGVWNGFIWLRLENESVPGGKGG
jgi:alkanesulfonate monooxygenase SsuD/methylene tetrahydromethanopterin reductase-like flavin-dependent oxidoreductase (luciferase family)